MFTRHSTDFAPEYTRAAAHAAPGALRGAMVSLLADTMLECTRGWCAVQDLRPSDTIATLDGGFVPLAWVRRALPGAVLHIQAGSLGNCSDLHLPADARIGLAAPADFEAATTDMLSVPLRAFEGLRGIRKAPLDSPLCYTIGLASEEMIWAQTGMLVHARPLTAPFFHALSAAETRALLAAHAHLACAA